MFTGRNDAALAQYFGEDPAGCPVWASYFWSYSFD